MTRISIQPGYAILAGLAFLVFVLIAYQSFWNRPPIFVPSSVPAASAATSKAGNLPNLNVESSLTGQASVIDGDTIEIHGARIRFNGIDAPESQQTCEANGLSYRCGQKAALALSDIIGSSTVSCAKTGTDRWRRVIAKCFSDSKDLSRWMVSTGWAIAYRKYSLDYVLDEERARTLKIGIWAGTFLAPEEWRKIKQKGG